MHVLVHYYYQYFNYYLYYYLYYNCKYIVLIVQFIRGVNLDWNQMYTSLELCGIILEFIRKCPFIYCLLLGNESGSRCMRYSVAVHPSDSILLDNFFLIFFIVIKIRRFKKHLYLFS